MVALRAFVIFALSIPAAHAQGFGQVMNLPVKLVRQVDGRIVEETIPRSQLESRAPKFVRFNGKFYDSVATYDRLIVQGCLAGTREGETVRVDHPFEQLCRSGSEGDVFQRDQIRYAITRRVSDLRVDLRVRLKIDTQVTDIRRAQELLTGVKACLPEVEKLWQKYSISMKVQIDSDRQPSLRAWDQEPTLYVRNGRSNTAKFYYLGQSAGQAEATSHAEFCVTLAHELGHYVGLPDEYDDVDCPSRQGVFKKDLHLSWWPYDLMSTLPFSFDEAIDVYPWDVQTLLEPLCAAPLP